jgi:hypothetical protein
MSTPALDDQFVVATFITISSTRRELQGQWIPVSYWAFLVSQELSLDDSIAALKLQRTLEKRSVLDRELNQCDADSATFKFLHRVLQTKHYVAQRPTSFPMTKQKQKKVDFLCVCMTAEQSKIALELPTKGKLDTVTEYYKKQYTKYANRVTPINSNDAPVLASNTQSVIATEQEQEVDEPPAPTRPVTPPNSGVAVEECKALLAELLTGIINPSVLQQDDLFSIAASTDTLISLKSRIQSISCRFHKENFRMHYKRFYEPNTSNDDSIEDIDTLISSCVNESEYLVLTEQFNVPLSIPALQDIVKSIVNLSASIPEVLELRKHGGSKGTSKRLVAITPETSEKSLYLNAYRWMPQVLDAAIDSSTAEMASYHTVSTLIRVLSNIDEEAFTDVCDHRKDVIKPKLDALMQKALLYDAHLSQVQFKLI